MLLMEQRVLCLKITWGLDLDNSFISASWFALFNSIQFIFGKQGLMNDPFTHRATRFTAGAATAYYCRNCYQYQQGKKYFFHHVSFVVKKPIIAGIDCCKDNLSTVNGEKQLILPSPSIFCRKDGKTAGKSDLLTYKIKIRDVTT